MSRKPNDTPQQKSGAEKSEKAKSTFAKGPSRKRQTLGPIDEETPITVSNGSIQVRSMFDREDTGGKKHKHCKVGDTPGKKKWVIDRVEVYDDDGIHSYPIVGGEAAFVMVWFKRPL